MKIYKIKCPKCHNQADAYMKRDGAEGTYREVYHAYSPYRLSCSFCNLLKEIEDGSNYKYELWYKSSFKNNTIWANNNEHIDSLIDWLKRGKRTPGDRYEALPKWMLSNRESVIKKLLQMREN